MRELVQSGVNGPGVNESMLFAREAAASATRDVRFAALVERQSRFVFRVVWAVLRNVQDAEDVVQETFLKLYRSGAWEKLENERAFLARAAWRLAVDRVKTGRRDELPGGIASPAVNPEQEAIATDWNASLHRLIDALPEDLRQPLVLSAVEELTSKEIAQVMGIPEGTVRTRIMKARQILKQKISGFMENRHDR
jgi:RNA polymerase sigma-70 factor (ECF subfamily)